ncbi:MAG: hypothetical protein HY928_09220 [Elusimicrobia bacterium]|nr:hypothetical protein [Elusimicrobiota bacterium]
MRYSGVLLLLAGTAAVFAGAGKPAKKAAAADPFVKAGSGGYGTRWRYPSFNAVVDVPPGFERVQPKKNRDIAYQFAMRHSNAAFEVRLQFAAQREDPERARERKECVEQNRAQAGSCFMADLDAPSPAWIQAMAANMNAGEPVQIFPFPADGVKAEFGADWGFVSEPIVLDLRRDFNTGYKFGQVVLLHRGGVGKLYRIILAGSFEELRDLDKGIFYNVRFEGASPPGLKE